MAELALQLWFVREEFEADYEKVLKEIAELGFKGVEFAGFYDVAAEVMKEKLDKYNLKAAGSHTPYEKLVNEIEDVITYNKTIENNNIVCPYYELKDSESLLTLTESLRPVAKRLKEEGMNFYYHNHSHELVQVDGEYLLDLLFKGFDEGELRPEIDTYWIFHGGLDPISYLKKYKGVCDMVHLKDGTKTEAKSIGTGDVDIKSIISAAEEIQAKWVIIEDESVEPKGLESVRIGMQNLKKY